VTSARQSPTLSCALGLAWVPVAKAGSGQSLWIRCQERDIAAEVVVLPFFDPEMKRQKS
jgi:glycine cleavage system aminomethyltransferase T